MYFQATPEIITTSVNLGDNGEIARRVGFQTLLDTNTGRRKFGKEPSELKDGRAIDTFPCHFSIEMKKDGANTFTFVPTFEDSELRIYEPDQLEVSIFLPLDAFEELWDAVKNKKQIIFGGKVESLPKKDQYGPGGGPSVWDVEKEDNRVKPVSGFYFSALTDLNYDTATTLDKLRDYRIDISNEIAFATDPKKHIEIALRQFSIVEEFCGYFDDMAGEMTPVHNVLINAVGVLPNNQDTIELFDQKIRLNEFQLSCAKSESHSLKGSCGLHGNSVHVPKEVFIPFYEMIKQDINGYAVTLYCHVRKRENWLRLGFEKLEAQRKYSNVNEVKSETAVNPLRRIERLITIQIFVTCLIWLYLIFK